MPVVILNERQLSYAQIKLVRFALLNCITEYSPYVTDRWENKETVSAEMAVAVRRQAFNLLEMIDGSAPLVAGLHGPYGVRVIINGIPVDHGEALRLAIGGFDFESIQESGLRIEIRNLINITLDY